MSKWRWFDVCCLIIFCLFSLFPFLWKLWLFFGSSFNNWLRRLFSVVSCACPFKAVENLLSRFTSSMLDVVDVKRTVVICWMLCVIPVRKPSETFLFHFPLLIQPTKCLYNNKAYFRWHPNVIFSIQAVFGNWISEYISQLVLHRILQAVNFRHFVCVLLASQTSWLGYIE